MKNLTASALLFWAILAAAQAQKPDWQTLQNPKFTLHFTPADKDFSGEAISIFEKGVAEVEAFFGKPFPKKFDIFVFPQRAMLDKQWQQDWGDSTFQSACWMVASGVSHRFDLLSPRVWAAEACEHKASDSVAVFKLFTHELVHVYHGQHCKTPDFAGMDALGWWLEGLAVFTSGQLDEGRLAKVREQVAAGKSPEKLEQFWSGKNKYGLAGSVVAMLDGRFGRKMLADLLPLNSGEEIFKTLGLDENAIRSAWMEFLKN